MRPLAFTIILATAFRVLAAAQSALQMVPPDAAGVFGIELRGILDSPAGASLKAQFNKPEFAKMAPFRDALLNSLDSVLIAVPDSSFNNATQPPVLIIVKGRFELAAVRSIIIGMGKSTPVEKYRTVELLSAPDSGVGVKPDNNRVALLDANTILAGDRVQVRAAIDRIQTGRLAQTHSGILEGVAELAAANHVWMSFTLPRDAVKDVQTPMNQMFSDVKSAQLGVSFVEGLAMRMNVRTKDSNSAALVAQTVQGLIGMAALSGGNQNPQLTDLLAKVKVAPEGSQVKIALTLNQSEFDKMIRDSQAVRMAGQPVASDPVATRPSEPAGHKPIRIIGLDSGAGDAHNSGTKK